MRPIYDPNLFSFGHDDKAAIDEVIEIQKRAFAAQLAIYLDNSNHLINQPNGDWTKVPTQRGKVN